MKLAKKKIKTTNSMKLINLIDKIPIKYHYFIFLVLIALASLFFCTLYISKFNNIIDDNNNMIFKNITFGHGPLIDNLINKGSYYGDYFNIKFVLQKLPVLPILIFLLAKITHNFYILVAIKNLILFTILFFSLHFYLKSLNIKFSYFFIYFIAYLVPYNMLVTLNFEYADNIVCILLPCLFLILLSKLKNKYFFASVLFFLLYLTKTSMLFLCIITPIVIIIFERETFYRFKKYTIIIGPILAMIIWASFSYIKTDRIAFGSKILSVNSIGMSVALNEKFREYFPQKSMDLIHSEISIPKNIKKEWELSDYFDNQNKLYLSNKENLFKYISNIPIKLKFIFFHINRDSAQPDKKGEFDNSIRYSLIPNKIFINLAFVVSIFSIVKSFINRKIFKEDYFFVAIFGTSLLPFLAAWATSKHLVPISIVCFFYLILKIKDIIYFFKEDKSDNIKSQN